jgi:hypothetical protein
MSTTTLEDRNWDFLLGLLPAGWQEEARTTGACTRRRGFTAIDHLLRGLLLHVGIGVSLRETAVLAKAAGWLDMSDVALMKKLRQSERWLQSLCQGLLRESALAVPAATSLSMRLIDGTLVKEPGRTGSQWRVHYSLRVPEWTCDDFALTDSRGEGTGESLRRFRVRPRDCLIADRGFASAAGIGHVQRRGGYVIVRHVPANLPLEQADGTALPLLEWLRALTAAGQIDHRGGWLREAGQAPIPVRLCAIRKSAEAVAAAQRRIRRRAQHNPGQVRPETFEYAQWVIVLTTVPLDVLSDSEVLEWYRVRWQIELAFKRLKSLADLGHLPKHDPASSRAWLYGKLLMALLTEKMQRHARAFSPWGVRWCDPEPAAESLA